MGSYPVAACRGKTRIFSGFSPLDVPNLELWYDFSDTSTLYQDSAGTVPVASDGDVIGRVNDKSINSNDASTPVTAGKTTYKTGIQNGLSVSRWDAGGKVYWFSDLSLGLDCSLFFVLKKTANVVFPISYDFNNGIYFINDIFTIYRDAPSDTNFSIVASGVFVVLEFVRAGGNVTAWVNGTASGPSINAGVDFQIRYLGARDVSGSNNFMGDYCEFLAYSSGVSNENRLQIQSYLNKKWGVF